MHELTVAEALLLGLLQGLTEWLPISSSGHLVIAQSLFGVEVPAAFDIVIMTGTTAALILYFRNRILTLVRELCGGEPLARQYFLCIMIAGIATAAIGFPAKHFFIGLYSRPLIVSLLIIVTGLFLYAASRPAVRTATLSTTVALLVGIAQGLAVAPGISRSGSTIGTAMLLRVPPREAAEFSFIIGIPAMLAASLITALEEPSGGVSVLPMVAGVAGAFIAGYASIGVFMRLLESNHLDFFAYYCIAAGSIFAVLTLVL